MGEGKGNLRGFRYRGQEGSGFGGAKKGSGPRRMKGEGRDDSKRKKPDRFETDIHLGDIDVISHDDQSSLEVHEPVVMEQPIVAPIPTPKKEPVTLERQSSVTHRILDLGFTLKETINLSTSDQQYIFKNQIRKEEWPEKKKLMEQNKQKVLGSLKTDSQNRDAILNELAERRSVGDHSRSENEQFVFEKYLAKIDARAERIQQTKVEAMRDVTESLSEQADAPPETPTVEGNPVPNEELAQVLVKEEAYEERSPVFEGTVEQPVTIESLIKEIFSQKEKGETLKLTKEQKQFYKDHKDEVRNAIEQRTRTKHIEEVNKLAPISDERVITKMQTLGLEEQDFVIQSPEFFTLSPDKQLYVLSKMEQKIFVDAERQSTLQTEKDIEGMKVGGFFDFDIAGASKKIWASAKKGWTQIALRDQMIAETKHDHLKKYGSDMNVLVSHVGEMPNLRYIQNEKGKMVPLFEYVDTNKDDPYQTQKAYFNVAASRLSEIPEAWSAQGATKAQKDTYYQAATNYNLAKTTLIKALQEEGVKKLTSPETKEGEKQRKKEVLARVEELGGDINFSRLITQTPQLETNSEKFFEKLLGGKVDKVAKAALYAGVGYGARWLGKSLAFTGVGLGVSAAVGGLMSVRKKNLEYSEKELRARYGEEVNDKGVKKLMKSEDIHKRLEKLVDHFENTPGDETSKRRTLESIKDRVFVTQKMRAEGRINFGKANQEWVNNSKLSNLLARAMMLIEFEGGFDKEKTQEEKTFERFTQFIKDAAAEDFKEGEQWKSFRKGLMLASAGYAAGALIRYLDDINAGDKLLALQANALNQITSAIKNKIDIIKDSYIHVPPTGMPTAESLVRTSDIKLPEVDIRSIRAIEEARVDNTYVAMAEPLPIPPPEVVEERVEDIVSDLNVDVKVEDHVKQDIVDIPENPPRVVSPRDQIPNLREEIKPEIIDQQVGKSPVPTEHVVPLEQGPIAVNPSSHIEQHSESLNSAPEAQDTKFDFQEKMQEKIKDGYVYTENPEGGAILSKEIHTDTPINMSDVTVIGTPQVSEEFVPGGEDVVSEPVTETPQRIEVTQETGGVVASPSGQEGIASVYGKEYKVSFGKTFDGKEYIPVATTIDWDLGNSPARTEAMKELLKPEAMRAYPNQYAFNARFDRIAIADEVLDSGKYPVGSPHYQAFQNFIQQEKAGLVDRYGEIFQESPTTGRIVPPVEQAAPSVNEPLVESEKPERTRTREASPTSSEPVSVPREIARTDQDVVYEYDSKNVKGQVKFVFKADGSVEKLQVSETNFNVRGDGRWRQLLTDDWKDTADQYGIDTKKVNTDIRRLIQLRAILSDGNFHPRSSQAEYLLSQIKTLEIRNNLLLKRP